MPQTSQPKRRRRANSFRGDTEHVLFGIKGRLAIPEAIRESNFFAAHRQEHSRKPDRFYELVERVSPGPYLEHHAWAFGLSAAREPANAC